MLSLANLHRMDNVANEFADMLTETLTILKRKLDATIEELREDELNYNESKRRGKHLASYGDSLVADYSVLVFLEVMS